MLIYFVIPNDEIIWYDINCLRHLYLRCFVQADNMKPCMRFMKSPLGLLRLRALALVTAASGGPTLDSFSFGREASHSTVVVVVVRRVRTKIFRSEPLYYVCAVVVDMIFFATSVAAITQPNCARDAVSFCTAAVVSYSVCHHPTVRLRVPLV